MESKGIEEKVKGKNQTTESNKNCFKAIWATKGGDEKQSAHEEGRRRGGPPYKKKAKQAK